MRENWEWEEVKPQVHKVYRDRDTNDHLLLLAEGRLVNLGNAMATLSHYGRFVRNQVLAQIHIREAPADLPADEKAAAITVEVLQNIDDKLQHSWLKVLAVS